MATKAAKSITINATKYELANALDVSDGKIQLKAKDVVLDEIDAPAGATVVEAALTSDMSITNVGISAGWRGMSFTDTTFSDVADLLEANKVVYIALKGSTNHLTAFAPLSLTMRFAAEMWSPQLSFVADGSVFTINDTPEIKRNTSNS